MQLRKLFAVAAAGVCLAFGALAQTDPAASSMDGGARSPAKSSKKKSTKKSSKTSKSSRSSKKKKAKKTQAPAQQAAVPDLPVPDDGEAPKLTHEALGGGSRGKPLAVAAHADDPNGVYGPVLYVRKQGLGAGDYVPIRMAASKIVPGDYSVEVPAALTNVEVLEYYLEAWDMAGNGPAQVGTADAPLAVPLAEEKKAVATVMIHPKGAPPAITHSAVAHAPKGKPVEISARLVGDTGVQNAAVMFRHTGEKDYKALPMGNIGGDDYTATIPAAMVTSDLEYYLEAYDKYGNGPARSGSPGIPYSLKLAEAVAPVPAQAAAPVASKRMLEDESEPTYVGLGFDGGAPGGAGLTLLVRPLWWLRLNAGLAYNVAGFGWRGGVSLAPGQWTVTPTLNLDVGQYLSGDFNKVVTITESNPAVASAERALLAKTTYKFATAQLGLEFGSQRRFVFYVRGGITYFESTLPHAELSAIAQSNNPDPSNTITVTQDVKYSSIVPCASLGFNIFIY
ncbi:MAG TPA: hypothetical protein VMK66_18235 [Myxococcales bacterium]|nr:hypothetical protein [Myxococcales bacterium]